MVELNFYNTVTTMKSFITTILLKPVVQAQVQIVYKLHSQPPSTCVKEN